MSAPLSDPSPTSIESDGAPNEERRHGLTLPQRPQWPWGQDPTIESALTPAQYRPAARRYPRLVSAELQLWLATTPRSYSTGSLIGLAFIVAFGYAMIVWRRNRENARKALRDDRTERRPNYRHPDYDAMELRPEPTADPKPGPPVPDPPDSGSRASPPDC